MGPLPGNAKRETQWSGGGLGRTECSWETISKLEIYTKIYIAPKINAYPSTTPNRLVL